MNRTATTVTGKTIQLPEVMACTIMPAKLIAKAWVDEQFRQRLRENLKEVVLAASSVFPEDAEYRLLENTLHERHLVLPHCHPRFVEWGREKLSEVLDYETGDDRSLEYWLPPAVILECFLNEAFKRDVLSNPEKMLASQGYEIPAGKLDVHANEVDLLHLALPTPPLDQGELDFDVLLSRLNQEFGGDTTKCCASGTCD